MVNRQLADHKEQSVRGSLNSLSASLPHLSCSGCGRAVDCVGREECAADHARCRSQESNALANLAHAGQGHSLLNHAVGDWSHLQVQDRVIMVHAS